MHMYVHTLTYYYINYIYVIILPAYFIFKSNHKKFVKLIILLIFTYFYIKRTLFHFTFY